MLIAAAGTIETDRPHAHHSFPAANPSAQMTAITPSQRMKKNSLSSRLMAHKQPITVSFRIASLDQFHVFSTATA